jgi:uncharacterized damage-inducible protein DinB
VPGAPAVAVGGRAVHGWNPTAYAELLGVAYKPPARLSPKELAARQDRILESAARLLSQIPDDKITWSPPERNRTLRQLGFHVFRLSLAFVEAMDRGELPKAWLDEPAPAELADGRAIARYGELVRGRLTGWFEGAAASEFDRMIKVYYGPQSSHDLLERTTWHAAQHLRQLYALADRLGVTPREPMPADQFRGLPLPDALW